jgi:hypothetical protein
MSAPSAAKSARPAALQATATTLVVPDLGKTNDIFVLTDGTRLFSSWMKTILLLLPSGWLATLVGNIGEIGELKDGEGISARFKYPPDLTVDRDGNVVVTDRFSHAIRKVSKAGVVVRTLAGNGESGFADGQGEDARFNCPHSVVVTVNIDLIVSDLLNHCLRVVTPEGAVCTLVGNGQRGLLTGRGRMHASTHQLVLRWTRRGTCWWPIPATTRLGRLRCRAP